MCQLITLNDVVPLPETPFTSRILIIGSLLPRVCDLRYTILDIFCSDIFGWLYPI
jgi:hypothetical protein